MKSEILKKLSINESILKEGNVKEWIDNTDHESMCFHVSEHSPGIVKITRLKNSRKNNKTKKVFETLEKWNGTDILMDGEPNTIRMYVSRYNKENGDCFKVKYVDGELFVYKLLKDLENKPELNINEFNFVHTHLLDRIKTIKGKVQEVNPFANIPKREPVIEVVNEAVITSVETIEYESDDEDVIEDDFEQDF